ncbi:transcriptional regulator, AraC family [Luminiphilus syltensis NOR5-1B]|uniref:Transcriptional regulator, AraC family n=1 Tax=Luminiphilus syltensis NOR5-1B TaxID=565045 RepID=B8KU24_9GAMM|nr:AraC family transcriptional regulator [Luminiphilus syltensis]EED34155.1 transcriptional regulator, AraC family [Luminiphilus syltensis NOR5-1B]
MSAPSKWPLPAAGTRFITPGFMVDTLKHHALTSDCYPTAMGYYPNASGHRMRRQQHDDNLLIYCVAGRGEVSTDGWSGSIGPGGLLLLPKNLLHEYQASARDPWSVYWVHFQGSSSEAFFRHLGFRRARPMVDAGRAPALASAFQGLMEVRHTGYSSQAFILAGNQLRFLLAQFAVEAGRQQSRRDRAVDLEQIQQFMREHITQNLSLDALAAFANLSKFHFSKRYKQLTGYSPIKHFLNMKMEHACQLLDATDMSIQAVASALGYDDPLYFSRLFRQTIGTSPRDYRASITR